MPKSHAQSDTILRRFMGTAASSITATYVNLLTAVPTGSEPTGWVEWRSATDTAIVRKRIYAVSSDGSPYWQGPTVDGDAKKITNSAGVEWGGSDVATLLDDSQLIVGVGVFTTSSTTYSSGAPNSLADLIYWNTLTNNITASENGTVVFLAGDIKVTEQ